MTFVILNSRYEISGFGLVGKSSGGYGALVRGMKDDCWDAIACHSGDCGFELLFGIEMASTLTQIGPHGGEEGFLKHIKETPSMSGEDFHALMILAMSASYSDGSLPVDENCKFNDENGRNGLNGIRFISSKIIRICLHVGLMSATKTNTISSMA